MFTTSKKEMRVSFLIAITFMFSSILGANPLDAKQDGSTKNKATEIKPRATKTNETEADKIKVELTLPALNVNPYHNPFVAVWLETPERKYVTTIALWANDMEWYKDLRQWWRQAGRSKQPYDSVTGATKKPGTYTVRWSGKDGNNNLVPPGTYIIKVEASREEGGREYLKTQITIDQQGQILMQGQSELGPVTVDIINSI